MSRPATRRWRAVAATRYPPHGLRGVAGGARASRYGRVTDYLKKADNEICLLVQVETRVSLEKNLEEIASVSGVDGVFIGPSDLSASFGLIGQPGHPDRARGDQERRRDHPQMRQGAGHPHHQ